MEVTHDRLQAECFQWFWNTYPEHRGLLFAALNELKPAKGESRRDHMIRVNNAKALGLVSGVYDLIFYWHGNMYPLDCKVGKDRLSAEQKEFRRITEQHGATCQTFSSFEGFQQIVFKIMET